MRVPKTKSRAVHSGGGGGGAAAHRHPGGVGRFSAAGNAGVRLFTWAGNAGLCGAGGCLRCGLRGGWPLQDAHGPRFAGLWGTALLAGGFLLPRWFHPRRRHCFCWSTACPRGWAVRFWPRRCWPARKSGTRTKKAGPPAWRGGDGAFRRFLRCSSKGGGGLWGIRVCFAALGAVMLVVCGAGGADSAGPAALASAEWKATPRGWTMTISRCCARRSIKLCAAAVALSARRCCSSARKVFQIATGAVCPESPAPYSITCWARRPARRAGCCCPPSATSWAASRCCMRSIWGLPRQRLVCLCTGVVGSGGLRGAALFLLRRRGGAAVLQYGFVRPAPCGVNYGFIALGMSGGSILRLSAHRPCRWRRAHWLAGVCAAAGLLLSVL